MNLELKEWYAQYVYPLAHALNSHDLPAFTALHGERQRLRDGGAVPPDTARALDYMLAYYSFIRTLIAGPPAEREPVFSEAQATFSLAAAGVISSLVQRRYRLQSLVLAHNYGIRALPRDEMERMLAELPPSERHSEQWIFISEFYFQLGEAARVAEAYETFLEIHGAWAADYNWRRLNVMLRLLDGTAIQRDAELLLRDMPTPDCLREIRRSFWPHFQRVGFDEVKLQSILDKRLSQLERSHPTADSSSEAE